MTEEGETGETRITKMFDKAMLHAWEYGADGIEVKEGKSNG